MLSRLFIAALWSPEGKGLTSWLLFVVFGILGQVWFLIVLIPDPSCLAEYFYILQLTLLNFYPVHMGESSKFPKS